MYFGNISTRCSSTPQSNESKSSLSSEVVRKRIFHYSMYVCKSNYISNLYILATISVCWYPMKSYKGKRIITTMVSTNHLWIRPLIFVHMSPECNQSFNDGLEQLMQGGIMLIDKHNVVIFVGCEKCANTVSMSCVCTELKCSHWWS